MIDYDTRSIADILNQHRFELKEEVKVKPGPQHQFHSSIIVPRWVENDIRNIPTHSYESKKPSHKLDRWLHEVATQHLRLAECRIRVIRQSPLQIVQSQLHFEPFKDARDDRTLPEVRSYLLFITDQECGQTVQTQTGPLQWLQGDIYTIFWYATLATSNASWSDRSLVQFEGFDYESA